MIRSEALFLMFDGVMAKRPARFQHREKRDIEKTEGLIAAQRIASHADVRTTQRYVHVSDEHLREVHRAVFE